MSFPLFIAKRFILSKKESGFLSFISSIAIIGIALGVATLIITLSILKGFEQTITDKLIAFNSHIQITGFSGSALTDYEELIPAMEEILFPYNEGISPFVIQLAIISTRNAKEGVSIKGVFPDDIFTGVRENIIEGSYSLGIQNELPEMVIGKKLATKLLVGIGDRITIFALDDNKIPSPVNPPKIEQFIISGIFESGMAEYDDLFAYINLGTAQQLFNMQNKVNGYDIKLNDLTIIDSLASELGTFLRYPHYVRSIFKTHQNIFTWIELQKSLIPVVLFLIIIVAVFNIISTILMLILEKTNAIGTLRSVGASSFQVIKIFLYQGIYIALIGIIAGNILGYTLSMLQLEFDLISIPASVYLMSSVPIQLSPDTFVLVSVVTLFLCIIASLLPSYVAAKIKPVSILRFQ